MLAATHGVGLTRSQGLLCEAPAAVLLHAAHRELVRAASTPELEQFSASATATYTALVEGARWFTALRAALDAYFAAAQTRRQRAGPPAALQGRTLHHRDRTGPAAGERVGAAHRSFCSTTLMTTLWSGRFDQAPDAAAFEWGSSFGFDRRLFDDDVTGSLAWARALAGAGVLTADESTAIQAALTGSSSRGARTLRSSTVTTRMCTALSSACWSPSSVTRASASTPDDRATSRCRWICAFTCAAAFPALQQAVAEVIAALTRQARAAGDALMPSYTHFRPAQPVLVAHFLLAHAAPLRRDHDRLSAARREAGALTLGSGAIAGTSYAVDVHAIARELGFERVVANSIDASSDRDFAATFLYASSLTMVHLSRLAEDLIILCGDEHRFFEFSDALSTGSSMMPQKKNPDPLELVRGKTGRAIGDLMALLTTMKGIPSGYNKDLQEDKHVVFDAEDTLAGCTAVVKSVIDGLSLNRERAGRGGIRTAAGDGRCRLPGGQGRAVQERSRNCRRAGAEAHRRAARVRLAQPR